MKSGLPLTTVTVDPPSEAVVQRVQVETSTTAVLCGSDAFDGMTTVDEELDEPRFVSTETSGTFEMTRSFAVW